MASAVTSFRTQKNKQESGRNGYFSEVSQGDRGVEANKSRRGLVEKVDLADQDVAGLGAVRDLSHEVKVVLGQVAVDVVEVAHAVVSVDARVARTLGQNLLFISTYISVNFTSAAIKEQDYHIQSRGIPKYY